MCCMLLCVCVCVCVCVCTCDVCSFMDPSFQVFCKFGNSCNLSSVPLWQPVQLQQHATSATRTTSVARRFGDTCDLKSVLVQFCSFTMVQMSGILRKSHLNSGCSRYRAVWPFRAGKVCQI